MNKSIKLSLITLLWVTTLSMLGMDGAERTDFEQQQSAERSKQQDTILRHNTFFHERDLQNLKDLQHTHQEGNEKGLSTWTGVKTWFSHRKGLFGKKGNLAIVEDALERNLSLQNSDFTFNNEEQNAFKSLSASEQLEFMNEWHKNISRKYKEELGKINQKETQNVDELEKKLKGTFFKQGLTQEIAKLKQKLRALETQGLNISYTTAEITELKQQLDTKDLERTRLMKKNTIFSTQIRTDKNKLLLTFRNKIQNLAAQINPLLHASIYLRFNETAGKFEFHKTDEQPIYKRSDTEIREEAKLAQIAAKKHRELERLAKYTMQGGTMPTPQYHAVMGTGVQEENDQLAPPPARTTPPTGYTGK